MTRGFSSTLQRIAVVLTLAVTTALALLTAAGCGTSARTPGLQDEAGTEPVDAGFEAAETLSDAGGRDAPADVVGVDGPSDRADAALDAASDSSADAGSDATLDATADGSPADAGSDAALDATADGSSADAGSDAALDAAEGGCVAVPAPTVRWRNPLPQGNTLNGVWGSSANDVYAVGEHGTILHSADRGQSWQPLASGTTVALRAVWGSGADDVYIAGARGTILHSTDGGASWTPMTSGTDQTLFGLWGTGADDVYAVGGGEIIAHRIAQGAWTAKTQISHSTVGLTYRAVYGSGGTVWVVGDRTVLRSTDGGVSWTDAPVPNTLDFIDSMTSVEGTLYLGVLGFSGNPNLFVSNDGGDSWSPVRTADQNGTLGLATAGGSAYAVGTAGMIDTASNGSATFGPLISGTQQTLNAVWVSDGGDIFAVGTAGVILHADSASSAFTQTPAVTRETLLRLWGSPEGDLVAVGSLPDIVQSSDRGAHFTLRTPTGDALRGSLLDVAGLGDDVYAVGYDGILHSADRGVTWALDLFSGTIPAVTVNAGGVYAVDDAARVRHKAADGTWTATSVAGAQGIMSDFWSGDGEMWAVGGAAALHAVAGAFSFVRLPAPVSLSALWGRSAANLIGAGLNGEIALSTDHGASWTLEKPCWPPELLALGPTSTTPSLHGVCGDADRAFAVGEGGTVLVSYDDVDWTAVPSGTSMALYDCLVDDMGTVYIVGSSGAILTLTLP